MKKLFLILALFTSLYAEAQHFDDYFTDATLRIDYIFSGNAKHQEISLDKLNRSPRWYGKHKRLAEIPVEGNGQITVRHHHTGIEIHFQRSSRNGSLMTKQRLLQEVLKTFFSYLCPKIL